MKTFEFTEQELSEMKTMLALSQQSYAWMLKDILERAKVLNEGNHSDELKLAIDCGEFMEKFKRKE